MKVDWLSAVLRTKHYCLKKGVDLSTVVSLFAPLLEVVLETHCDESDTRLLTEALSKVLEKVPKEKLNEQKLAELRNSAIPDLAWKSGALDKVSDDCLKHALSYLGPTERCVAVECTCQRLFHLSRRTLLHFATFEGGNRRLANAPLHRLRCQLFKGRDVIRTVANATGFLNTVTKLQITGLLPPFYYTKTDEVSVLDLGFLNLSELSTSHLSATQIAQFVEKTPTVTCVRITGGSVVVACAEQLTTLKQLRSVELYLGSEDRIGHCDFSHIRDLRLHQTRFYDVRRIVHSKLNTLLLEKCTGDVDFLLRKDFTELRRVAFHLCETLDIGHVLRSLRAPNLEECSLTCAQSQVLDALVHSTANTLKLEVISYWMGETDAAKERFEWRSNAKDALRRTRVKLLTVVYDCDIADCEVYTLDWFADNLKLLPTTKFVVCEKVSHSLSVERLHRLHLSAMFQRIPTLSKRRDFAFD